MPTTHGERAIATHPRVSIPTGELPEGESPAQILRLLGGSETSEADRRQAVLLAEVLDFEAIDRDMLCTCLRRFVLQHRNSNVAQDLVAVGAAIRKLVAYLSAEELGTLNEILTPSPRMAIPLEIELEVVKTVVRKLTWQPPLHDDSEPELADKLLDIASTYLNPRLLPREKYGATTLNAVLSLLLLRSRHVPEVIALVEAASVNWFTQLACRRVERLRNELRCRVPEEAYPMVTGSLVEFTTRLCHMSE